MPLVYPVAMFGGGSQALGNALVLNGTDEALTRTAAATSANRAKFTWDVWIRRREIGRNDSIHSVDNAALGHHLYVDTSDRIVLFGTGIGPVTSCHVTSTVTVPAEVWTHVHVEYDTALAAGLRVQMWINGVASGVTVSTAPSGTNINFAINGLVHSVGRDLNSGGFFKGDIALFHWIDSLVVPVTDFADTIDGTYQAIEATGLVYDTNGHFLDFADANDLGNDPDNARDHTTININASNASGDGPPIAF